MPNLNSSQENKSHTTPSQGIHSKSKHTYHNVFGNANLQYHDFDNGDALTFTDKYTALLQELQNPYWCLHNPITTKSYQISSEMDIEIMPHAMYFSGDKVTITQINQVPYQVIDYDDKGMFQAKLMNNMQVEILLTMELHHLSSHLTCIISTQYCRDTQKQKAILLFIQEES